jgi:hypothetical protein
VAQGVRPQRGLARGGWQALALAAAGAGCGHGPARALPEDPAAALEAVLARCHGPLRRTLDRITVELRTGGPAGALHTLQVDGPSLRARQPDGTVEVLTADAAWRWREGEPATPLDAEGRTRLDRLRLLVAAAYLTPLESARRVVRAGPATLRVEAADGTSWRLDLDPRAQRPARCAGPAGDVRFASFLDTGITLLPADVELGSWGPTHLRLLAHDVLFEPDLFAPPAGALETPPKVVRRGGDEPRTPALRSLPARSFLALPDPGDWAGRVAAIVAAGRALSERGQTADGLPFLYAAGSRRLLGVPFAPATDGGPVLAPRADEVVERRPEQLAVVLYRPKEAFETSLAAGTEAVQAFAAARGLAAAGPLRVVPHLAWDGDVDAAALAAIKLRFELPVARPPR